MRADVIDLRDFYAGRLGQATRRLIRHRLRALWPDLRGQRVLGLGYATPYLGLFRDEAERVLAFMPASQGVLHWPVSGPGLTALVDEARLPLPDRCIDRIVIAHALESAGEVQPLLRECWRVLADSGRMIAIVPNRTGLWAQFEHTPFGHGYPYSAGQLSRLFRDNMFAPVAVARALFVPPTRGAVLLRLAPAIEKLGLKLFERFGGVLLIEAGKQLYAGTAVRAENAQKSRRRPVLVVLPDIGTGRDGLDER